MTMCWFLSCLRLERQSPFALKTRNADCECPRCQFQQPTLKRPSDFRNTYRSLAEKCRRIQERDAPVSEIERFLKTEQGKNAARQLNATDLESLWVGACSAIAWSDESTLIFALANIFPHGLLQPVSLIGYSGDSVCVALDDGLSKTELEKLIRAEEPSTSLFGESQTPVCIAIDCGISKAALQKLIRADPRIATTRIDLDGRYLLHKAASINAPPEILQVIYDFYPGAVKCKDYAGNLPIHAASSFYSIDSRTRKHCACVDFFLQKYPSGALEPNKEDETPLYNAVDSRNSWEVLALITRFCGKSEKCSKATPSLRKALPLKRMCISDTDFLGKENEKENENVNTQLFLLLNMYPEAALQGDEHHRIPFQMIRRIELANELRDVLFFKGEPHIGDQIARMVDVENGSSILHLLCSFREKHGKENVLGANNLFFIRLFVEQCPHLTRARNNRGQLPLHVRLETKENTQDVYDEVEALLSMCPKSAGHPDPQNSLLPFMIAAKGDGACVKTTFLLLQRFLMYRNLQDMDRDRDRAC